MTTHLSLNPRSVRLEFAPVTRLSLLTLLALLSLLALARPSWAGEPTGVIKQSRAVSSFSSLEVSGGLEVRIKPGATGSLVLEGEEGALSQFRTSVDDRGRLVISRDSSLFGDRAPPVIAHVTTTGLGAIDASGGVRIRMEGGAKRSLALDLSGGVTLSASQLSLDELALDASGGVELNLAGTAEKLTLDVSGGVVLDGRALLARRALLDASGGCELSLRVQESLKGEASGGVDIKVAGRPRESAVDTSGGSRVRYTDPT